MSEKNNEIMKYVGEKSLIRFKENADRAYSPMEHKHSYNDLNDKTHYDNRKFTEILNDCTFTTEASGIDICVGMTEIFDFDGKILEGQMVEVVYDGVAYQGEFGCAYYTIDGMQMEEIYFGNSKNMKAAIDSMQSNGIGAENISITNPNDNCPFTIKPMKYENSFLIYIEGTEPSTHTISVSLIDGELKQLDEKFIPDSVKVQANWNCNDETSAAYIQNRPFYITDPQPVEVISDKFTTVPGMNGVYANLIEFSSNVDFQIGDKTKVIFDGVEYDNLLVKLLEENTSAGYIGNGSIISTMYAKYNMFAGLEDTGEPFMIQVDIGFNEGVMAFSMSDSEHQITLISYKPQYKPIPYEFLGIPIKNGTEFCSILINDVEDNKASGKYSYAEGCMTSAVGHYSHSEGQGTKAIGNMSHAEGSGTEAHGMYSHAEGHMTKTDGENAHAEGLYNQANGANSHVSGERNIANKKNCFVFGKHNVYEEKGATYIDTLSTMKNISEEDEYYMSDSYTFDVETGKYTLVDPILVKGSEIVDANKYIISRFLYELNQFDSIRQTDNNTASSRDVIIRQAVHYSEIEGQYVHIVGNGENGSKRSNAHTLDWDGNAWFAGDVYVGGTSGTNKDEGSKKLSSEEYVDSLINNKQDKTFVVNFELTDNEDYTGYNVTTSTTFDEVYSAIQEGKTVIGHATFGAITCVLHAETITSSRVCFVCIDENLRYEHITKLTIEMSAYYDAVCSIHNLVAYSDNNSIEATAIILKSPNGTRFSITVGDDGVLTASEITEQTK